MMKSQRKFPWIIVGGGTCLLIFVLFIVLFRQASGPTSIALSPSPTVSPSATPASNPESGQKGLAQIPFVSPPEPAEMQKEQLMAPTPPPFDKTAAEIHQKLAVDLKADLQERTRRLYGAVFQQLGLSANVQEKVIDILTQQQRQLEEQAFQASESGSMPAPPSLDSLRTGQAQQDEQLRAVLGNAAFAQLDQYRATIPDHIVVDSMNQQGANLSENQSQQLVQILSAARQQIVGQAGIAQNVNSMSPDQAATFFQQQQALLQQAVGQRVQSLLSPEQAAALKGVLSQSNINPKNP